MAKDKLLRVTQMNAIYLDKEIVKYLQDTLRETLKYLPNNIIAPLDLELRFLVKVAVIYCSVVQGGSTFGQNLLSIKYKDPTKLQKSLYLLISCFDYFKNRLEFLNLFPKLNSFLFKLDAWHKIFTLLNVTWFLRNGSKPQLIERLLGLEQVYAHENAQRKFDSKYLGRELLWNGFIEVLVYVLPLINYHKVRRRVRSLNLFSKNASSVPYGAMRQITLHTKCAYCGETPVYPHHMGCSHIFCYVCLKGNLTADEKFQCSTCDYRCTNVLCERVVL